MVELLVIGSSEADIFSKEREMLLHDFNIRVTVNSSFGRKLEECIDILSNLITPRTNVVILCGLTFKAWEKTTIRKTDHDITATVFKPKTVLIDDVPQIMTRAHQNIRHVNSQCTLYLSIPTVKDMYQFNQTRLERVWGNDHRCHLYRHNEMNPHAMRDHSVNASNIFESLGSERYKWPEKRLLFETKGISHYYTRSSRKQIASDLLPHRQYLSKKTSTLKLDLLPDGLHGSKDFLYYFLKRYQFIFKKYLQEPINVSAQDSHPQNGPSNDADSPFAVMATLTNEPPNLNQPSTSQELPVHQPQSTRILNLSTPSNEASTSRGVRMIDEHGRPDLPVPYSKRMKFSFGHIDVKAFILNGMNKFIPDNVNNTLGRRYYLKLVQEMAAEEYEIDCRLNPNEQRIDVLSRPLMVTNENCDHDDNSYDDSDSDGI